MPIDLGTVNYAVLVADADTPTELRRWVGTPVPIPDGVTLPVTQDSITFTYNGQTLTFWGYARTNPTNGNTEFVLSPAQDPDLAALDQLPGANGWLVENSRQAFRQIGLRLRELGVSRAEARPLMVAAWSAIVAERNAQIIANGGSLGQ